MWPCTCVQAAVQGMESQHGQRLGAEAERYAALQRDLRAEKDTNAGNRQALHDAHAQEVQALSAAHAVQLQVSAVPNDATGRACPPTMHREILPFAS